MLPVYHQTSYRKVKVADELINDSSAVRPAVTRGHIDVTRGHIDVTNLAPLQLHTLLLKKKYGLGRLNMCNLLFAK